MRSEDRKYPTTQRGWEALSDEMRGLSSRGAPLVSRSWVIHRCEQILRALTEKEK